MRATRFVLASMMAVMTARHASAQEWIEYQNKDDGFKVVFPSETVAIR
jgi:hypothetical protein